MIRQRMRALLKELVARSEEKRPCGAMERPVRGRSSSASGRGERNKPDEQIVPHQICRCQCGTFVSSPQNARKCQSCGHDVHDHQTLSKAECHRIRRRIAQEVVKEHSRRRNMEFWQDLDFSSFGTMGPAGLEIVDIMEDRGIYMVVDEGCTRTCHGKE